MKFYPNKTEISKELGISRPTLDTRITNGDIVIKRVQPRQKYYICNTTK